VTYRNREDAGRHLAAAVLDVPRSSELEQPLVLGVVRGGVPVALEVATVLGAELAPAFATKIGAPGNPELAVGALADATPLIDPDSVRRLGISEGQLVAEIEHRLRRLQQKRERFASYVIDPQDRHVIVVDDGVATGHTIAAVLDSVRRAGSRATWLAVPVGPPDTVRRLADKSDMVICPLQPVRFRAVGAWYESFPQLTDDDVAAALSGYAD